MTSKITSDSASVSVSVEKRCQDCQATDSAKKVNECLQCRGAQTSFSNNLSITTKKFSGVDLTKHFTSPVSGSSNQSQTPSSKAKGTPIFSNDDDDSPTFLEKDEKVAQNTKQSIIKKE